MFTPKLQTSYVLFVAENITTNENQYLVHYSIQMYLKLIGVMESAERERMEICKSEVTKGNLCLLLFYFSSLCDWSRKLMPPIQINN